MAQDQRETTKSTVHGRSVRLERVLRAPVAQVWKAYATRESLEQWFWPMGRGKAKEFDLRPGGQLVMAHAEHDWVATWRFKEVVPERRIVFEDLWPDGSGHVATGTIEFQRVPEGTRLVVDFGPFPTTGPYRLEDAVKGFAVTMDRLAELVEAPASPSSAATTLRLERTFDATPEQLWAAWTDPAQYAQWLNPAPGHDLVIHEWDLRVGGRVRFDMPQPDGNRNPQEGVFHKLDKPRELISGNEDKSFLVRALFEPAGKRTRLVVEVTGLPPEWHQPATVGWNQGFDKLERVLRRAAAMPSDREVVIHREYDAPPERVWAAWTDPQQLARWFGPDGFRITTHAWDFRVGGMWRFTMHGPDGTDYPNWIRYTDITRPRRLAYDHGGGKLDEAEFQGVVTFEDLGGRTRLTLRSVFPSKEARDHVVREYHAIEGGQQTLARLAEHLGKSMP